jgi:hypothetical protein
MSFNAYTKNIKKKTGKTSADFIKLAEKKGLCKKENLIPLLKLQKL